MEYTPNIKLPQYTDNDTTSYLTVYNETMSLLDTAIFANQTNITKNDTDIATLENQMSNANDSITQLETSNEQTTEGLTGAVSRITALEQQQSSTTQAITNLDTKIDSVADVAGTIYSGTLSTGEETLAIAIGAFANNTLVDVYTSVYGVNPLTIELREATSGQPNLCVMTFDAQTEDVNVSVVTRGGAANGTI